MISYTKLELSLGRLEEQYRNHIEGNPDRSELDNAAVAESVIQRFETCYDTLWKVLRRFIIEDFGIAEVPNAPRPLIRLSSENNLLRTSISDWMRYVDARIGTAHDYDEVKAQACLEVIPDFIDDVIGLYQTMTGETW